MKPSNTGRDWYSDLRLWEVDAETDRYVGGDAINLIAEAAAQIAIAEYRKELAAKVARMDADTTDPEMIASEFHYKYGWNDAIRTFRVLLNENDNAE